MPDPLGEEKNAPAFEEAFDRLERILMLATAEV
jgi:hypothetical protein